MVRPRDADDFATIRARLGELRHELARAWANGDRGSAEPQTGAPSEKPAPADKPRLPSAIRRALFK